MGECQAVVADAVTTFGRVDILLCCTSQGTNGDFRGFEITPADDLSSTHWNRRRAIRFATDLEPRSRPIRGQLLRTYEHHQSHTTPYEERSYWSYNDLVGNQ